MNEGVWACGEHKIRHWSASRSTLHRSRRRINFYVHRELQYTKATNDNDCSVMIRVTSIQFYSLQIVENDEDNIENRQASRTSQEPVKLSVQDSSAHFD